MVLANTHWSKNPYGLNFFFLPNDVLANSFIFSVGNAFTASKILELGFHLNSISKDLMNLDLDFISNQDIQILV